MIVIGADTHKQSHTCAAAKAGTGELAGARTAAARKPGFRELLDWGRRSMSSGSGRSRTAATSRDRSSAFWSPRESRWSASRRS